MSVNTTDQAGLANPADNDGIIE
ncbi:MAG TPA: DUF1415 domain-containing protein, partial [Cupriavidus sp.]|nr:DUF1415 domain-containing protein [Cupriavidus sp.]